MHLYTSLLAVLAAAAALCTAKSTFDPVRPPSLPLAVKSPYMSTLQQAGSDSGNGGYLAGQWPAFWYGQSTGWTGYIRVDNISYVWMGLPNVPNETNYYVTQTAYEYTPTRSIFTMEVADIVGMTITFLSPVLPETILEMSLPYSYMDVEVYSLTGKHHSVQLYTDISAEWVAGDRNATAQWTYGKSTANPQPKEFAAVSSATWPSSTLGTVYGTQTSYSSAATSVSYSTPSATACSQTEAPTGVTAPPAGATRNPSYVPKVLNAESGGVAYHEVWRQQQLEFSENSQQAEWGYWYYATENTADLTHQSGSDNDVRAQFVNNGYLTNAEDDHYRAINQDWPVFGFATDLGTVTKSKKTALFQISLHQLNCIRYEAKAGNESVPCMWTNYFDTNEAAVSYFYSRYDSISKACTKFDNQVKSDSNKVDTTDENSYYSLTALATRQAFGALTYTNTPTQPWVFLKEISSNGDTQTVDVIFPFHPILLYANAKILRFMLDPLFINQEAGFWPYKFAEHDLGTFPNAVGYNNLQVPVEIQPVEECGNMIIMALAYAQRTGDNAYLAEHYDILAQWSDYLIRNSLIPNLQLSTDDFLRQAMNDTNLALKGLIGIEAMAQIANRTGHANDGASLTKIAHDFIDTWYGWSFNYNATPPHEEAKYNTPSYDLLYNLYSDALLGLQLVEQDVYDIQSNFYPTVFNKYGVPLRSMGRDTVGTKADWEMFCAAIASEKTKNQFISVLSTWLNETSTSSAFTDLYNTETGDYAKDAVFITRPVVGAMFSLLALESAPKSAYVTSSSSHKT